MGYKIFIEVREQFLADTGVLKILGARRGSKNLENSQNDLFWKNRPKIGGQGRLEYLVGGGCNERGGSHFFSKSVKKRGL